MNTKQTAVEWLVEKFNQCEPMYSGIQSIEHKQYLDGLINKAKELEKQQIMQAVFDSMGTNFDPNMGRAEQYYNETYGPE